MQKLEYDFFNRNVVEVARDLLGKTLHFHQFAGIVTETEAYRGSDDEASHAFKGPTKRSGVMFGPAGYSYVYLIYGMYNCLNIVAEEEGSGAAILIRGLKLPDIHLDGPGKICRHVGITREHSGINLIGNNDFYVSSRGLNEKVKYSSSSRIGIKKAIDKQWRFYINGGI